MLLSIILKENKMNDKDILQELQLAPWQYDKVLNNLRNYKKESIKKEIVYLSKLDYRLKSGLINKDVVIIDYIMNLCS